MRIDSLDSLVKVADVGSFSRAADLQHVSLSGLSAQMQALERELGTALFDRTHRPPRLTPVGARVAEVARTITAEAEQLRRLCRHEGELTGRYRLGVVPTMAVRRLPGMLGRARTKAPLASFTVTSALSDTLADHVMNGTLDAAVLTAGDDRASSLTATDITSERIVIVAPTSETDRTLQELASSVPFIHFRSGVGIGQVIARALAGAGAPPAERIDVDGVEAAVELVNQGLGYTMVPEPDGRRYAGRDSVLLPHLQELWRQVVLISNPGRVSEDEHRQIVALWRTEPEG